jgi:hypothetical protein
MAPRTTEEAHEHLGIATTGDPERLVRQSAAGPMLSRRCHSERSWRVGGAQNCSGSWHPVEPVDTPLWPHCSGEHVAITRAVMRNGADGRLVIHETEVLR